MSHECEDPQMEGTENTEMENLAQKPSHDDVKELTRALVSKSGHGLKFSWVFVVKNSFKTF